MNDKLQKILADAKVGKAEFDTGSYYVCSEGTMKTIIKSVVDACAEEARRYTFRSQWYIRGLQWLYKCGKRNKETI
jgi:hypothetical protein